jgi:hypothetical protein
VDANNDARALMARAKTGTVAEALAEFYSQVDTIEVVNGVCGDSSNGTPDQIDRVNSTWV